MFDALMLQVANEDVVYWPFTGKNTKHFPDLEEQTLRWIESKRSD